jgi:hypothetical protein
VNSIKDILCKSDKVKVRESCRAIGEWEKGWTCENPSKDSAAQTSSTTRPKLPVEERENPAENHTSPGSFKTDSATPDVLETEEFNPQENHSKKRFFPDRTNQNCRSN